MTFHFKHGIITSKILRVIVTGSTILNQTSAWCSSHLWNPLPSSIQQVFDKLLSKLKLMICASMKLGDEETQLFVRLINSCWEWCISISEFFTVSWQDDLLCSPLPEWLANSMPPPQKKTLFLKALGVWMWLQRVSYRC